MHDADIQDPELSSVRVGPDGAVRDLALIPDCPSPPLQRQGTTSEYSAVLFRFHSRAKFFGSGRATPGGCGSRHTADLQYTAFPHTSSTAYIAILIRCFCVCTPDLLHLTISPCSHAASDSDSDASSKSAFYAIPRVEHNYSTASFMSLRTPHPVRAVCMLSLTSWVLVHLALFTPSMFVSASHNCSYHRSDVAPFVSATLSQTCTGTGIERALCCRP